MDDAIDPVERFCSALSAELKGAAWELIGVSFDIDAKAYCVELGGITGRIRTEFVTPEYVKKLPEESAKALAKSLEGQ